METITITFGDQAENHVGMQKIGTHLADGSFFQTLDKAYEYYSAGFDCDLYDLSQNIIPADLLVVRNYLPDCQQHFDELSSLDWDKKAKMWGRVCNKKARHNLCFADFSQDPDYESGKGRVYDFKSVPLLDQLRGCLETDLQELSGGAVPLVAEGNYYYNESCYIGYHGDTERKLVMGLRLGSEMSLMYQWHKGKECFGTAMEFVLQPGDLYIMSSKAIGNDWKRAASRYAKGKNRYALRHSARF